MPQSINPDEVKYPLITLYIDMPYCSIYLWIDEFSYQFFDRTSGKSSSSVPYLYWPKTKREGIQFIKKHFLVQRVNIPKWNSNTLYFHNAKRISK